MVIGAVLAGKGKPWRQWCFSHYWNGGNDYGWERGRQPKKQSEGGSHVEVEVVGNQLDMHRVGLVEKMGLEDITADEWVDGLDEEFGSQMDPTFEGGAESNLISSDSKAELKTDNLE
ncbi:hypothetical protein V6N11_084294 [Hibiscus sabdariffa]|uniref:Uncharacterized protein n=1 Tax=Hibiscus sabdariffa TaxID=183260 RepID=A0ABR2QSM2_9ROSI